MERTTTTNVKETTMRVTKRIILAKIEELQVWFASRPYGYRENATPAELAEFEMKERIQEALVASLKS